MPMCLVTDVSRKKAYFSNTAVYYDIPTNQMRETIAKEVQRVALIVARPAGHEILG